MGYESPFRRIDDVHDSCNPLCLDVGDVVHPAEATWLDFFDGALCRINGGGEQTAFALSRHFVELSLKLLHPSSRTGHDLKTLLDDLPPGDPLQDGATSDADSIRRFILELHEVDATGTEGRYGVRTDGRRAFESFCCIEREVLVERITQLFEHVRDRIAERQ